MRYRATVIFSLALLLSACASVPHSDFERVEIVALPAEALQADAPSGGESAARGAATGAAVGAVSGLAISALGSIFCGPFYAACFAASAPLTVGATAVAGGVMGGTEMTAGQAVEISTQVQNLPQELDLNRQLAAAVAARLPESRVAETGPADARLAVGITTLRAGSWSGKLSFQLGAQAVFDWKLGEENPRHAAKDYLCSMPLLPTNQWTRDDGQVLKEELGKCIQHLAGQIKMSLEEPEPDPVYGFDETQY